MISYFEVNYIYQGKRDKQVIKANTRRDALSLAKAKMPGGTVLKAIEISPPLQDRIDDLKSQIFGTITQQKVKTEDLISAIRQLAVMTNAGISIHDSIREVTKSTEDKQLKAIFEQADDDLNAGKSLTESLKTYKYQLGDITIAMVELGENTGNMSDALSKLAQVLEEMMENAKKLKSALRYPTTVIIAIAVAFSILMIYVVPKFKDIFEKLNAELPVPTKILLFCEHALNNYGLYILATIIGLVFYHKFMYKNNKPYKEKVDTYILKVYLIGDVIFYASMNRFMLIFTELVRAGVPIVEALDTAVMTVDNENIKGKLSNVKVSVQRGANLTESFEDTELFEGMLIQMVKAGEQGGALDKMLEKVTDYYKNRFQNIIENMSAYIEPILIGFIAGMVLMLALGIFLPMWDMASAVKH